MMKQELIHSHIIVAMFCGWEPQKPNKEFPNGYVKLDEGLGEMNSLVSNDNILEELPYQTDWNYLMAAWKKFDDSVETILDKDNSDTEVRSIRNNMIDSILNVNLEIAFKELVRGVDYINQLTLQEDEH